MLETQGRLPLGGQQAGSFAIACRCPRRRSEAHRSSTSRPEGNPAEAIITLIGNVVSQCVLKSTGRMSVLLVEQDFEFATKLADRYYA